MSLPSPVLRLEAALSFCLVHRRLMLSRTRLSPFYVPLFALGFHQFFFTLNPYPPLVAYGVAPASLRYPDAVHCVCYAPMLCVVHVLLISHSTNPYGEVRGPSLGSLRVNKQITLTNIAKNKGALNWVL